MALALYIGASSIPSDFLRVHQQVDFSVSCWQCGHWQTWILLSILVSFWNFMVWSKPSYNFKRYLSRNIHNIPSHNSYALPLIFLKQGCCFCLSELNGTPTPLCLRSYQRCGTNGNAPILKRSMQIPLYLLTGCCRQAADSDAVDAIPCEQILYFRLEATLMLSVCAK